MVKKSAYLKIFAAYFIWSFWGPFMNKSTFSAFQNIFLISLFAFTWVILILLMKKSLNKLFRLKLTPLLLLFALVSGLGGVVWLKSLTLIPIAQALFLFASVPLFALLIELVAFRQKPNILSFSAIAIGVFGIFFLISGGTFIFDKKIFSIGALLVLSAAFLIASQAILIKKLSKNYIFEVILLLLVFSQIFASGFFAFKLPWVFSTHSVLATLAMSIFALVIAFYFYGDALKFLRASTVRLIGYIEPLLGSLWGVVILSQPLGKSTIIGGFLILLASYLAIKSGK